jgi:hypothetical protein
MPYQKKTWKTVNVWSIKGPFLVFALLLGYFGQSLQWGRGPMVTGLVMLLAIIGFRAFWDESRFWITLLLLGAV